MPNDAYFHGYSTEEQQRLIRQAEYWSTTLIPLGLSYKNGERVLEIGCGVGATPAVLANHFPGIQATGIDIERRQIAAAERYLESQGITADLQVADGSSIPLESSSVDHVYMMWFVEHMTDSVPVLSEALRVLRPGGTIVATETDYEMFKVSPECTDWDYVDHAQHEFFAKFGNPTAGRQLGALLRNTGFEDVTNAPVGFHYFQGGPGLKDHVNYVADFLEPGVGTMAELGFDESRLGRGIDYLRQLPDIPGGSMTQIVFRAHGTKGDSHLRDKK